MGRPQTDFSSATDISGEPLIVMANPMHRPTIVLADDHHGVLTVASMLVETEYHVVATVEDAAAAVRAVAELKPDVVVLDIGMPGTDGIQAANQLRGLGNTAKVVFLTIKDDSDCIEAARAMGASYVLKAHMYSDLLTAINEALAGRLFFSSPLHPLGYRNLS
jgi:DNA-binding NarL/FixJ family response regulator